MVGSFFDRTNFLESNEHFLQKFESSLEEWRKIGHNILQLYNVLLQTRLTTSNVKRDI